MRIRPMSARAGHVVADYELAGVSNYGINAVQVPSVSAAYAGGHGFALTVLLRNTLISPAIPRFSSTLP